MAELDDFEQEEQIKRWIKHNVPWIVGGVVIGLAGIFGYRHWEGLQLQKTAQAADLYDNIVEAYRQEDPDAVTAKMKALSEDHPDSSYELFGALFLAKQQADEQSFDAAIATLQSVQPIAEKANFADLVRTRIARLYLAKSNPDQALAQLAQNRSKAFKPISQELMGDAYVAKDELKQAQAAYREALVASKQPTPELLQKSRRVEQIVEGDALVANPLDSIGNVVATASAAGGQSVSVTASVNEATAANTETVE